MHSCMHTYIYELDGIKILSKKYLNLLALYAEFFLSVIVIVSVVFKLSKTKRFVGNLSHFFLNRISIYKF